MLSHVETFLQNINGNSTVLILTYLKNADSFVQKNETEFNDRCFKYCNITNILNLIIWPKYTFMNIVLK